MQRIFVDTGAFYAMADRSDAHHLEASLTFQEQVAEAELVTTDHVCVETWFLICAHLHRGAAMRFWQAMESGVVTILGVNSKDFWRGRQIAVDWPDQKFSIVDCTSFALIERLNIACAFAFDRHFRVIRLGAGRTRRLTLLPR
ncbi:MAG TPA: PIN domain-containing protein [Vicinamibacteria bacterium]